jgi:hypothetical protein
MRVRCDRTFYRVVTAEEFTAHDEDIYVWAILMPESKAKESYYDDFDR